MSAEIFFCHVTPSGRGAIATTVVWGNQSLETIRQRFTPTRQGRELGEPNSVVYGIWQSENSSIGEDVVLSFDDQGQCSIHSHGGIVSQQQIARSLIASGATEVPKSEYERRICPSFWLAEIRQALQQAASSYAALCLLDQLACWSTWPTQINQLLAADHRDEAIRQIDAVLQRSTVALHLTLPWNVVLCGRPNVGKSSLINALLGYERTIVSAQPGTTRDIVRQRTVLGGWPVTLSDTAGIREAEGEIERIGVEFAQHEIHQADALIGVFDASEPWTETQQSFLDQMQPDVIVFNKLDLARADPRRPAGMFVSATHRQGLDELIAAILAHLVPADFDAKVPLPVTAAMVDRLRRFRDQIAAGDKRLDLSAIPQH